jgi:sugar diacid utilization regulator
VVDIDVGVVDRVEHAGQWGARAGSAVTDVATELAARLPVGVSWGVALVVAPDLRGAEAAVRTALPKAHIQRVTNSRVAHLVVRIPLPASDHWRSARKSLNRLTAGTGCSILTVSPQPEDGADAVERRRMRAQSLLPLLGDLPIPKRVLDMEELMPFDVFSVLDPETQSRIVRRILGPVLDQPGGIGRRQLATLEALHWHDGSVKSAAAALGVHTKTIHNRVRRIEQLTGLWLDHPPDRLRIDMALYLLRARRAGITPEG